MKKLYIILLGVIISLGGCTDHFEDLNKNPNIPAETASEYLFNYVVVQGAGEFGVVTSYNYTYIQRWIMQTAAVWGNSTMPPYTLFDDYRIEQLWKFYYANLMQNCKLLEQQAKAEGKENMYNVARIWSAYNFHKVTDLWGDVPYSEAWKSGEGIKTPKYDTQEQIYKALIKELKEAAAALDVNNDPLDKDNDLIYEGNIEKWRKFANSLRLRLAVRSGNTEEVAELVTENNFIANVDEGAVFSYIESKNGWSPYYSLWESTKESTPKLSWLMHEVLTKVNDPRLEKYAQPIEIDGTTYKGVPNLMDANKKENQAMGMGVASTSYIGKYWTDNSDSQKELLSFAEVCFLRAEAAFRSWTDENAQQWFEAGVEASLKYWNIEESKIASTIAALPSEASLEDIFTQKWVALYLNGWEAYAEYRRTGFPQMKKWNLELDGIKIVKAEWVDVPRDFIPGRLPYPAEESQLNGDNYNEAVKRMGGKDIYQYQLWWSKQFGDIDYSMEY